MYEDESHSDTWTTLTLGEKSGERWKTLDNSRILSDPIQSVNLFAGAQVVREGAILYESPKLKRVVIRPSSEVRAEAEDYLDKLTLKDLFDGIRHAIDRAAGKGQFSAQVSLFDEKSSENSRIIGLLDQAKELLKESGYEAERDGLEFTIRW